jgi:hypothetical protein
MSRIATQPRWPKEELRRMQSLLARIFAGVQLSWLVSLCALVISLLGLSEPALAQCSGALGSVTCPPAPPANPYSFGFLGNPYSPLGSAGINVNGGPTDQLDVTLEPGVTVVIPSGLASIDAVNLANTTGFLSGASATLRANDATVENNASPINTNNNTGLRIQSAGNAIITSSGKIDVAGGTSSDWAILDFAEGIPTPADATVKYRLSPLVADLITGGGSLAGSLMSFRMRVGEPSHEADSPSGREAAP